MELHLLLVFLLIGQLSGQYLEDKVTYLPGANFDINFDQYSGYLKASDNKYFHYWYVTANTKQYDNHPLIVWFNGGPRCSSLIGMLDELGPFRVKDNGTTVYPNRYAWNKVANVLFLESPAGVGFSYDTYNETATDDDKVAELNKHALLDFYRKFPDQQRSRLILAGESYAGVYIPTLAVLLAADPENFSNFYGVAIGNGALSEELDRLTRIPYLHAHGIISDDNFEKIVNACCQGQVEGCAFDNRIFNYSQNLCHSLLYHKTEPGDPFNIYNDCYLDDASLHSPRLSKNRVKRSQVSLEPDNSLASCSSNHNYINYLRREDVRAALHIPLNVPQWKPCAGQDNYTYIYKEVKKEYLSMIASGIKILTYNGDLDSECNFVMNERFLQGLGFVADERINGQEWTFESKPGNETVVAGYWTKYTNNTHFLIVRGAGHFVPKDKPAQALQMIFNFINGYGDFSRKVYIEE